MYLYIIRHGEPDYANDSLTANGKKQAKALAERLCIHGIDEIYSSPRGRAIQTALPACELLKLPYAIEDWMNEDALWENLSAVDEHGERDWAFGCQNTKLLEHDHSNNDWYANPIFSTCRSASGGYKHIADNADDLLARLGYEREGKLYKIIDPNEKKVAAFCHHGISTVWLSHMLSITPSIFWAGFDIAHSSVTLLVFRNNPDGYTAPQCMYLSDISHIYKENLPVKAGVDLFTV